MTRQSAKNKLEQVCKGAALVQFKVISPHLPGRAEENHEKKYSEYLNRGSKRRLALHKSEALALRPYLPV